MLLSSQITAIYSMNEYLKNKKDRYKNGLSCKQLYINTIGFVIKDWVNWIRFCLISPIIYPIVADKMTQ